MKIPKINTINIDSTASSILDMLRFLTAFVVFLFHFYVPLPGYQAVMIFFVFSGYFISTTVFKAINENNWSWLDYLLNRIIRLWIVLLPCLILTFFWAQIQINFFGEIQRISDNLDVITFVGNLLFLQGIFVENYGLNGPLWSLSYEFWYYILFPCLLLIFTSKRMTIKLIYTLIFIIISLFVGKRIMFYFLIWMLGALIPFIRPLKVNKKLNRFIILLLVTLIALFSTQYESGGWEVSWSNFALDLRVGIAFALLTYIIISFYNQTPSLLLLSKISRNIAGFSYSLYLAHYPVANFVMVWLMSPFWPFAETTLLIKFIITLFVLMYSWLIALLTEKHTYKVRNFIKKLIFNKKSVLNIERNNSYSRIPKTLENTRSVE